MKRENNLRFILNLICKYRKSLFLVAIIYIMVSAIDSVVNVLLIKYSIETIMEAKTIEILCVVLGIAILYIFLTNIFFAWFKNVYMSKTMFIFQEHMSRKIYIKANEMNMEYYDRTKYYDMYLRATAEADNRCIKIINSFIDFMINILGMFFMISVILTLDIYIIIITSIFTFGSLFFSILANKPRFEREKKLVPLLKKKNYIKRLFYLPEYTKELRIYNVAKLLLKQHAETTDKSIDIIKKFGKKITFFSACYTNIGSLVEPIIIMYLVRVALNGLIKVSDFVSLLTATQQYKGMLEGVLQFIPSIKEHNMYLNQYREFLDTKVRKDNRTEKQFREHIKTISLNDVNFVYPECDDLILHNLNINIHEAEKILVTGENGKGKSSLLKILLKLYTPSSGNIYLNDINYLELNGNDIRKKISVVFQDYQIYGMTIAENILMRRVEDKKDEEQVKEVLKACGLWEKVSAFEKGIYSMLTREFEPQGIVLSGGEKQRIALARAIVRARNVNADVLIFDEVTSSMDKRSEKQIIKWLFSEFKEKIIIVVSHSLIWREYVDKIYYLQDGRLLLGGAENETRNYAL